MAERFKAIVRRRDASDDEGIEPDEVWPAELRWIAEWDRFDAETEQFISGCTSAFETHAEALAEAVAEADVVRERNAQEATAAERTSNEEESSDSRTG
ncbi:hypothetical protein [Microbacterium sp. USHLN272]|uniref:hypothetical protein n=1 Tax=Microbacterium sp. USHLN272 TaxID=3081287 RepID=UPI003016173B